MNKKMKLSAIRTDGKTQSRKNIDPKWVQDYAEHMKEGAVFPLPVVFFDGKYNWLADGFHRISALKSNGVLEVEVEIREGSVRDAKLYAIKANNLHGRNMTFEEKRNNIIFMLKDDEWGKWSDERIAKEIDVARITIYRLRKKLEKEGEVDPKTTTTFIDKHGNETEMSVAKDTKKEEQEEEPEIVVDQVPTIQEPEPTEDEMQVIQMADTIHDLAEQNEKLKEQIALNKFEGNDFEKLDIQEMLADLREKNRLLELENKTLRESRDAYQYENAQLIKEVKTLRSKLKKIGA